MKKVLIIGGGVAGMTAAIYARRAGMDCEVLEKNRFTGGNLTGWKRNGCTVDNCIHWLTGTYPGTPLYEIWQNIGMLTRDTEVYRTPILFESEYNGKRVGFYADVQKSRAEMLALSPGDRDEINRFFRTVEAMIPVVSMGTLREKGRILRSVPDILFYRRTGLFSLAERFRHPLLKLAFTDYIGGEFAAIALLWAYTAYASGNGSLPRGGSMAAAERIHRRCLDLGCAVRTGAEVERIVVRNGVAKGVVLADGNDLEADYVIAACDPCVTFGKLLPADWIPHKLEQRIHSAEDPIFSALQTAFVCDRSAVPQFGTRIVSAPYFSSRSGGRMPIREYSHEPSYAPAGKVVLQTMVFQNETECRRWIELKRTDPDEYERRKREIGLRTQNAIRAALPETGKSLALLDVWTPATYHAYFGSREGAFMGYAMTPGTPLSALSPRIPHLKNVCLATQWLRSPGGLPNAAYAGVAAAGAAAEFFGIRSSVAKGRLLDPAPSI